MELPVDPHIVALATVGDSYTFVSASTGSFGCQLKWRLNDDEELDVSITVFKPGQPPFFTVHGVPFTHIQLCPCGRHVHACGMTGMGDYILSETVWAQAPRMFHPRRNLFESHQSNSRLYISRSGKIRKLWTGLEHLKAHVDHQSARLVMMYLADIDDTDCFIRLGIR